MVESCIALLGESFWLQGRFEPCHEVHASAGRRSLISQQINGLVASRVTRNLGKRKNDASLNSRCRVREVHNTETSMCSCFSTLTRVQPGSGGYPLDVPSREHGPTYYGRACAGECVVAVHYLIRVFNICHTNLDPRRRGYKRQRQRHLRTFYWCFSRLDEWSKRRLVGVRQIAQT